MGGFGGAGGLGLGGFWNMGGLTSLMGWPRPFLSKKEPEEGEEKAEREKMRKIVGFPIFVSGINSNGVQSMRRRGPL